MLYRLESAPNGFSDQELWFLLDYEWNPSLPAERLALVGFKLLETYDSVAREALVVAASRLLWEAYEREFEERDPDVALCLGNCLLFLAPILDQPGLIDEAIQRLQHASLVQPSRSDLWTSLASALSARFPYSSEAEDLSHAIEAARTALEVGAQEDSPLHANNLSNHLARLADVGRLELLDEAYNLMVVACKKASRKDPNYSAYLINLAIASRRLAERNVDINQARRAVSHATAATEQLPEETRAWQILADAHLACHDIKARQTDLSAAVTAGHRALAMSGRGERADCHHLLSRVAQLQFDTTGDPSLLDEALNHAKSSVRLNGGVERCDAMLLINLAVCLCRHAEVTGVAATLRRATRLARLATSRAAADEAMFCRGQLATILLANFERQNRLGDLTSAVSELWAVREGRPDDVIPCINLSQALLSWHQQTGDPASLREARSVAGAARQLVSSGSALEAVVINVEASIAYSDFEETGSVHHLDDAIKLGESALRAIPAEAADYPNLCHDTGLAYRIRYEYQGTLTDLHRALRLSSAAVNTSTGRAPVRAAALSQKAAALRCLFERSGDLDVLGDALNSATEAITIQSGITQWANLAACQLSSFEVTGEPDQLNAAIDSARRSVTGQGKTKHASAHTNLANALLTRFEFLGDLTDLSESIKHARRALQLTPQTSMWLAGRLSNYANALRTKAELTNDSRILRKAIGLHKQACNTVSLKEPAASSYLSNLALALADQGDFLGAVNTLRRAASLAPRSSRNALRANLAMALRELSHDTGSAIALNEAIKILSSVTRPNIPKATAEARLLALGNARHARYRISGRESDLQSARQAWEKTIKDQNSISSHRIMAAENLAYSYAESNNWSEAAAAYGRALKLLPELAWHGLDWVSREAHLARRPPLSSMACASALQAGDTSAAIEMIEAGRGLMWREVTWKLMIPDLAELPAQIREQFRALASPDLSHSIAIDN